MKNKLQLKKILKVPFVIQTKTSGNCGPCSVKMLLDYHHLKKPNKITYTVQSINKYLKVSKHWGCEENDIWDFFERKKFLPRKIKFNEIELYLKNGCPILALFQDELHDGHYGLLIGFDENNFIFHDPWPEFGQSFKRKKNIFKKQAKVFNNWFVVLDIRNRI